MKKILASAVLAASLTACSSMGDKVLQRSDDLSSRPDWASETVSSFESGNKTYFVGNMIDDGGKSTSWLCMAASNATKKDTADQIKQKLDFVLQAVNDDMELGVGQLKYIGTEASNIVVSNLKREGCYWEKVLTQVNESSKGVIYRVFAKLSIPTADLKAAIRRAMDKKGISKETKKQAMERWNATVGTGVKADEE